MKQTKRARASREAAPATPTIGKDEIDRAVAAEVRVKNSYHSITSGTKKHRGCSDDDVEPAGGSMLHALWQRGKLNRRQLLAWRSFWDEIEKSYGDSGPLSVSYAERVSTSVAGAPRSDPSFEEDFNAHGLSGMRLATWNNEWLSVNQKWEYLRREERAIIEQLVRDHIRIVRGLKNVHSHDVAYIGEFLSGYRDNRQAIAAGVSRIQAILTNLADMYMIPVQ